MSLPAVGPLELLVDHFFGLHILCLKESKMTSFAFSKRLLKKLEVNEGHLH